MEAKMKAELGDELYNACDAGDLPTVRAYLSHQSSRDPAFKPPLAAMMYVATRRDHPSIVQYCLASGGRISDDLLELIVVNRPIKTYETILTAKAIDVNYYIPWFGDMLTCVATEDDIEFTKLCLSHGADPNRNLFEEYKTALAAVAETASVEVAALLLDHGANLKNSGAIVAAAAAGKTDMVQFLLTRGANVDETGIHHPSDRRYDEMMGSALHQAIRKGHNELVSLLVRKGADVHLRDTKGRTPLALALAKGDDMTVSMLKDHGAVQ